MVAFLALSVMTDVALPLLTRTRDRFGAERPDQCRQQPDERLTLAFAPGEASYPLISYGYAVVSMHQKDPAAAAAFLLLCIEPSEDKAATFDKVYFIPELSQAQIQTIR
jgi:hypothetical protein